MIKAYQIINVTLIIYFILTLLIRLNNAPHSACPSTKKRTGGFAIACFILGIFGLLTSCFYIGVICSILSIVFGIVSLKDNTCKKAMPIIGISLASIGILIMIIVTIIGGSDYIKKQNELNEAQEAETRVIELINYTQLMLH